MKTYTETLTYKSKTATVFAVYCDTETEYRALWNASAKSLEASAWYAFIGPRWIRAFWDGTRKVIAPGADYDTPHENGHIFGLTHTPFYVPTTMNPTHLLRWIDREGLRAVTVQRTPAINANA